MEPCCTARELQSIVHDKKKKSKCKLSEKGGEFPGPQRPHPNAPDKSDTPPELPTSPTAAGATVGKKKGEKDR